MARSVSEIVNPEMFWVKPGDSSDEVLTALLTLRVTSAPVLDAEGTPLGVVSLRDLIEAGGEPISQRMTRPAKVTAVGATVEEAARKLADAAIHHLVAIDSDGRAVGMVSSLDVVRALIGRPSKFPAAFPHTDEHGHVWTDPVELTNEQIEIAPDGPGLFVLIHGGAHRPEVPVWAEEVSNVRTRLSEILNLPQESLDLQYLVEHSASQLRFRATSDDDGTRRRKALDRLLSELVAAGPR